MMGRTISHYRIEEELGAGGMGVVYRARDLRLQRDVAVKVLREGTVADDESRRRFRREALALSRLNHPAIETVHEFDTFEGRDFLVMEYLRGDTLAQVMKSERMPLPRVLEIGIQVATALAEAHAQGVVHRDLKPANIMVLPDGRVKVLDFGLATLARPLSSETADQTLTVSHAVVGTPRYMAPEQMLGGRADERTDLFALGMILYEAASGRHPFEASASAGFVSPVLVSVPTPPSQLRPELGKGFDEVIARCLAQDPERRHASAHDLRSALQALLHPAGAPARAVVPRRLAWAAGLLVLAGAVLWISIAARRGGAPTPTIRSLAVLPLANLSANPDEDIFAQSMTEELSTSLTQVGGVRVITRTAMLRSRDMDKPLAQIARELGVDAVVGGSVVRFGDRVRITAQLVRAESGENLWADRYERPAQDVFELQRDVAEAIARGIRGRIHPIARTGATAARPVDPQAETDYLRGRYYLGRADEGSQRLGMSYLERAVAADSLYAPAWSALAEACVSLGISGALSPSNAFPKAKAAAQRALELDEGLAAAHSALAHALLLVDWNWRGAEREFDRALGLDPNYAPAHEGRSILLSAEGRHQEAIADARRARELDPLSLTTRVNIAARFYYARDWVSSEREIREVLAMDADYLPARAWLGRIALAQRKPTEAIAEFSRAQGYATFAPLAAAYAEAGEVDRARGMLRELTPLALVPGAAVSPFDLAILCLGLGEREPAIGWLQRSATDRASGLLFLKVDPLVEQLHADPRFAQLLRTVGFPS